MDIVILIKLFVVFTTLIFSFAAIGSINNYKKMQEFEIENSVLLPPEQKKISKLSTIVSIVLAITGWAIISKIFFL